MRISCKVVVLALWLLNQTLGLALPALSNAADQGVPCYTAPERNIPASIGYDYGSRSCVAYDVELLPAITEGLSDSVAIVSITDGYDLVPISITGVVGTPRAPPDEKAGFLAAKSTTPLDWSIVSKAGETRAAHVAAQHGALNLQKPVQGVFYGNPASTLDDAWAIAQQQGIKPITSGGADIYVIPRANSGYAGGYLGQGQNLNTVTIITQPGTPKIITGYPGNGTPLPYP